MMAAAAELISLSSPPAPPPPPLAASPLAIAHPFPLPSPAQVVPVPRETPPPEPPPPLVQAPPTSRRVAAVRPCDEVSDRTMRDRQKKLEEISGGDPIPLMASWLRANPDRLPEFEAALRKRFALP